MRDVMDFVPSDGRLRFTKALLLDGVVKAPD